MKIKADEEITRSKRYGHVFSLIVVDLDKFKQVNDTYGHAVGDQVLVEIAQIFRQETRRNIDILARNGGDEFIILLPETGKNVARKTAGRIRRAVESHGFAKELVETPLSLTISLGLATYPPGEYYEEVLKRSDRAMYVAKKSGGNEVA